MWPKIEPSKHWRMDELMVFLATAESSIRIISPYMTRTTLASLDRAIPKNTDVSVVCSWRHEDLSQGFADPDIFTLCEDNNWGLRVDIGGHRTGLHYDRRVHIKAYVVDDRTAMIGSANLTASGMGTNIESMVKIDETHPDWTRLLRSILEVGIQTREADWALYDYVVDYIKKSKKAQEEKPPLPPWEPPQMTPEAKLSSIAATIFSQMPPRPSINDLHEIESIDKALRIRGLRFGEMRSAIRDLLPDTTTREELNQITNDAIDEILQSNGQLDIQKRYGTNCLVWKIHPILNEAIMSNLKPHLGKRMRELGLEKNLWNSDTMGSKTKKWSEVCMGLLTKENRELLQRLSTWKGTLRLSEKHKALYPRPVGERLILPFPVSYGARAKLADGDYIMLPQKRVRHELWMPFFSVLEAPKGVKLGDAVLLGCGLWESGREFVSSMERDFENEFEALNRAKPKPFFDNPFPKSSETEVIHTKVAALGGKTKFPLGHPERPMSRYLNTSSLTNIAHEILSHDH